MAKPGSSKITHEPLSRLAEAQVDRRPFGGHLDLGAGADVGVPGQRELLAIAAEKHGRRRRSRRAAETAASGPAGTGRRARTCGAGSGGSAGRGGCRPGRGQRQEEGPPKPGMPGTPEPPGAAMARRPKSPVHTAAFQVGPGLAGLVEGKPVIFVMDDDVGPGHR